MRRLLFPLLLIFVCVPAALAGGSATGDGALSVLNANGTITVIGKGTIYGQVDKGTLIVTDPDPTDGTMQVVGATRTRPVGGHVTVYSGKNITFREVGGRYKLVISASTGIDFLAVGVGKAWLKGDPNGGDPGIYTVDGKKQQTLPVAPAVAPPAGTVWPGLVVQFGVQPTTTVNADTVTGAPPTVLVVEDETSIASFVALYLKNAGYGVRTAATGSEALSQVAAATPALIVLDLMLPDIDGIEVCKRIRQRSDVPILMLTARDEDVDKIIGLEVGADDYLTKPFNPRELVARVKSILRRATPERRDRESETLEHGDLRIDAGRREVRVGDDEIQLAPKEFDLLWELLDHRGLVLTRDQLLERVWGYTFAGDTRTVDVHVRQLRRKLGDASPIVTVWGVGYKVSPAKEASKGTTKV